MEMVSDNRKSPVIHPGNAAGKGFYATIRLRRTSKNEAMKSRHHTDKQ